MRQLLPLALFVVICSSGCSDDKSSTEPSVTAEGPALSTNESTASTRWMVVTRNIVGRREMSPLGTARSFALVAVAQYNAAVSAGTTKASGKQPSEAAAVSSASAAVLRALYPVEVDSINAQVAADKVYFPAFASEASLDFAAGTTIGQSIATAVLARAGTDQTNLAWTGTIPTGPGYWTNTPPAQPVAPRWGEARPWMLTSGNQFRPVAPPAFNSADFTSALAEVKTMTVNRTADQLTLAQFWQFASGPGGPMGYFTELATGLTTGQNLNERKTARVYAVMHMAMMDASIGCWDAKYTYWYVRPYQVDPTLSTPVGRPNFPSYPSAHSCLSAAAAGVLTGLFPSAATTMSAKVAEAGEARIVAGLHYRFDVTSGQDLGRKVAGLALTRVPEPGVAIPLN